MVNLQKLSQTSQFQAIASQDCLSSHPQLWQEIDDTPAQSIQGGWSSGGSNSLPGGLPGGFGGVPAGSTAQTI